MDIFKRPPAISEDALHFTLYPPPQLSDKAAVTASATHIQTFVDALLPDFIWHRDPFEVKVVQNPDSTADRWLIEGRTRVGDCVDDEWCTVWILKEISAKWDFVISVYDTDGEFLLIEAAEALPSWVKPTNSENRVWIYNSRLHLIPISHISPPSRKRSRRKLPGGNEDEEGEAYNIMDDDSDEYLAAEDAIPLVRDASILTAAPFGVEKIVWQRISGYPTAVQNHIHTTKVWIPIDIAKALAVNPSLVQKAIETFYTRDALQLRSAHRMSRFPPQSSALGLVKMTRTAYAQLVGQKFFPPKVFGQWKERDNTNEWRWRDVGMKIAVGFEILYQESKSSSNAPVFNPASTAETMQAKKDALRRDPEYLKYIGNLNATGYFKGELEDSEVWKTLEDKAADIFVRVRQQDDAKRTPFAAQVNAAVSTSPATFTPQEGQEDSEDWLNVDFENFDAMLEQSLGTQKSKPSSDIMDVDSPSNEASAEDRLAQEQTSRLKELAAKVEDFVEGKGELGGALFEDETFSDESDDAISGMESDADSGSDSGDDDDEDPAARKAALEKLVPGIEPSDYGKMPSYYSNSQRVAPTTESNPSEDTTKADPPSPEKTRIKPIRPPIIERDKYEGVDSDDETDPEDEGDSESDEDKPQVVGDVEVNMEEEEAEFLEFSRQVLGITDDQWNDIVKDRKDRGAFLPATARAIPSAKKTAGSDQPKNTLKSSTQPSAPGPRPSVNPELDSFEAVMEALDAELKRHRQKGNKPVTPPAEETKDKGKGKATVDNADSEDEDDEDIEAALDAELRSVLERGDDEEGDDQVEGPGDYNLIKNFLESFKSQAGLSGPVSNLVGRLQPGWQLPRDDSS